jgi:hypothetical protein
MTFETCRELFAALGSRDKALVEKRDCHLNPTLTSVEESVVRLHRKLTAK